MGWKRDADVGNGLVATGGAGPRGTNEPAALTDITPLGSCLTAQGAQLCDDLGGGRVGGRLKRKQRDGTHG